MNKFTLKQRILIWLGVLSPCCAKPMSTYGYKYEYCMDEHGGCGKKVGYAKPTNWRKEVNKL